MILWPFSGPLPAPAEHHDLPSHAEESLPGSARLSRDDRCQNPIPRSGVAPVCVRYTRGSVVWAPAHRQPGAGSTSPIANRAVVGGVLTKEGYSRDRPSLLLTTRPVVAPCHQPRGLGRRTVSTSRGSGPYIWFPVYTSEVGCLEHVWGWPAVPSHYTHEDIAQRCLTQPTVTCYLDSSGRSLYESVTCRYYRVSSGSLPFLSARPANVIMPTPTKGHPFRRRRT